MLAGERRLASARRGGVLAKVVVPKPLNLPSQRLENHGLNPNVEIVPKGTLSWGSRSSSVAPNAWGSSTSSPNADGGTGSPSHLSGRPSSSGSDTRPSTAGSDRNHEPTANSWGPNSRPSSASGALTSNQTSLTSLRPRSAETRPGSSQLSRFAEPSSDNSVPWGPTGATEKLGMASSKNDGFSLSSGDFPTLGSERDNSEKCPESQDHGSYGRPSSSSDILTLTKEEALTSRAGLDVMGGSANNWKRDGSQHIGDSVQSSNEKWQGDPQQYLNANIPPQHLNAWHGPPVNAPGGVWFRGPAGGPPYGTPVAPGGFPVEPFPYFRPHVPPPALVNTQPAPPLGAGPRGHPRNGDIHRPQTHDAYICPGMPIRPGFYPGPMAYEGYYGPPMGYRNPNERDIPFMGMVAGPSVYNRYPAPNAPDPCHTHARAGGHGSSGKVLVPEHMESVHSDDIRGPYKALMKQQNEWDGKEEEGNWERNAPRNTLCLDKIDQSKTLSRKNEWGSDDSRGEKMYERATFGENASRTCDSRGGYSSDSVKVESPEMGSMKSTDGSWMKKSEIPAPSSLEVHQVLPATSKDSSLIQKIEGLNAKARASDGRHDVASSSSREEQKNRLHDVSAKASSSIIESGTATVCLERTQATRILIPASHEVGVSSADETFPPTAASGSAISRRPRGVQGRVDHRGKGRLNTQDTDGWRKKPLAAESSSMVSGANVELSSSVNAEDHCTSAAAVDKPEINLPGKDVGESFTSMSDPVDSQAQCAKMRERAKQRAIQLQKEEEEHTREQRAKALAKLEELNRWRSETGDGSNQKLETVPSSGAIHQEQDEPETIAEQEIVAAKCESPSAALLSNPDVVAPISESGTSNVRESAVLSGNAHLEMPKNAKQEHVVPYGQYLPLKQDVHNANASDSKSASQVDDSSVSRHKRTSYKQKQTSTLERNFTEKSITTEAPKRKVHTNEAVDDFASADVPSEVGSSGESSLPSNSNTVVESSVHQRRKNNRIAKNKHKLDDVSSVAALPSPVPNETDRAKATSDSGQPTQLKLDSSSVQLVTDAQDSVQPSEQHSSLPSEEAPGRVINHRKTHHSRRMPRNPQANKLADKFYSNDALVWAPVRSHNKAEAVDEASQKTVPDSVTSAKTDNSVQNSFKSKGAEMERYVPKPVAKELAQQGSNQPVSSLCSQTTSDEIAGRAESESQSHGSSQVVSSAIGTVGSTVQSRNEDNKQNKQAKAHGAWRQKSSIEASRVQGMQHGSSSTSNPSKNSQKSIEPPQYLKPEENSIEVQPKCFDEWNTCDGWDTPDTSDAAQPVTTVVKDEGVHGTGKQHSLRAHRNTGNSHNPDHKNINGGGTDRSYIHSAAIEMSQSDRINTAKETRGMGERTMSQWQPKSPAYSANNQQEGRSSGSQNVNAEVVRAIKKENPSQMNRKNVSENKESSEVIVHPDPGRSLSENKNVSEAPNVGNQEGRRERKAASSRVRPYSPNQVLLNTDELAPPLSADTRYEQRFSSGFRKDGNQSTRSGRGHESRGDYAGQDNRQHGIPVNRERQRHTTQYEYQPVGPNNNSKSNNFEGPRDGFHDSGSRYRERGQGHSKRGGGNFYERQSGTV